MYDPAVGRFISRDTFGGSATHPQTQNRYSYAGNNPVTFADPTGRASLADFFPTAAALAQAILAAGATQPIKLVTGGWTAPVGAGPVAAPCAPGMAGECPDDFDPSAGSGGAGGGKLPQDAKVNPEPPEPLPLTRPTSLSPTQNSFVQSRIRLLKANGASDFRVNQQQVDINGRRVGINRPDLQYTVDGERFYEEFETSSLENALAHEPRIMANDPLGQFEPFLIP